MPDSTVTVSVKDGPSVSVPWKDGITALQALEAAQGAAAASDQYLTFALQYFAKLGYIVIMINETYDSFISSGGTRSTPFYFWQFSVNGTPVNEGVSVTPLSEGDTVEFSFILYEPEVHAGTTAGVKYRAATAGGRTRP